MHPHSFPERELELSPDEKAELDRRWAEQLEKPDPAVSWEQAMAEPRDDE
jgi:putative addiction module component (TIGR02574 family)